MDHVLPLLELLLMISVAAMFARAIVYVFEWDYARNAHREWLCGVREHCVPECEQRHDVCFICCAAGPCEHDDWI